MTEDETIAVQRQACHAAITATVEVLLDLDIPALLVIETLASTAVTMGKTDTVRRMKKQRSNDDGMEPSDG